MTKKYLAEDKISVIMQSQPNSLARIDFDFLLSLAFGRNSLTFPTTSILFHIRSNLRACYLALFSKCTIKYNHFS